MEEQQKSPRWPLSAHLRNELTIKPPCQVAWTPPGSLDTMPGPCEPDHGLELVRGREMSLDA